MKKSKNEVSFDGIKKVRRELHAEFLIRELDEEDRQLLLSSVRLMDPEQKEKADNIKNTSPLRKN